MPELLTWDSAHAIARALKQIHPEVELEQLTLKLVHDWTFMLDSFDDDPDLVNDTVLMDIINEWVELSIGDG